MTKNMSPHLPVSPGCFARAVSARAATDRNTWHSIISQRQAWWIPRNGRTPAARPRCRSTCATRSPIGCVSCAVATCARRLARRRSRAHGAVTGLPEAAFDKADPSPDAEFYVYPRFVTHIDDGAIAAVTRAYREHLLPGGAVLDLMSSWVSHLPEDIAYASVIGHGMNEEELVANPRLSRWFVQDLNIEPVLPLDDSAFDDACLCVSVQYLQRPVMCSARSPVCCDRVRRS